MRPTILSLTFAAVALLAPLSLRTPLAQTATPASTGARVIVKYKADASVMRKAIQAVGAAQSEARRASQAQALGQRIGVSLAAGAGLSERSHVVFANGITSQELARRIAADADVEYAVPDQRRRRFAVPNDPLYPARAYNNAGAPTSGGPLVGQWYLKPPGAATTNPTAVTTNTAPSAINAEQAWDIPTSGTSIVVAVLDTGIRFDHLDLQGGNVLAGYDMISQDGDSTFTTANDGDGRDANAADPGDFVLAGDAGKGGCTTADIGDTSSWHGTETAGLIGAATDNNLGIASVGHGSVRILPVRVLGKCGGYDSDIVAGMLWAAGIHVPGVPDNPAANWARVINMSLGGDGACTAAYTDAVKQVNARGVVVVASAGNSEGHAVSTPANCTGVIGVAGLRHIGTKVGFSDLGPEISIAAPGGNCINTTGGTPCLYPIMTTSNAGSTTPVAGAAGSIYSDSFNSSIGTSFSAPLVAGTAALMLSVQPQLTPDEVRFKLQSTARAFPTALVDESGTVLKQCVAPTGANQDQCVCVTGLCGAGMLDAYHAVLAAAGAQARIAVTSTTPTSGQPVTLDAAPSLVPANDTISTYEWTLADGGGIVTGFTGATNGPTATLTPSAAGTFVVTLKLTDANGVVTSESTSVAVGGSPAPAPAPAGAGGGGGGGGALGLGWLLGLLGAVLALGADARSRSARSATTLG